MAHGSIVGMHGLSCSKACGIFLDQGLNLCPLHWQADSLPLSHQGSPENLNSKGTLINAGRPCDPCRAESSNGETGVSWKVLDTRLSVSPTSVYLSG